VKLCECGCGKPVKRRFVHGHNHVKQVHLEPSRELAYILGCLEGDGWVTLGKNHFTITLTAKDKDFVDAFSKNLMSIGLAPRIGKVRGGYKNWKYYHVYAYSRKFAKWFKSLSFEDIEQFLETDGLIKSFLKGYFDSDGSVTSSGGGQTQVRMAGTDLSLIAFVHKLLSKIGLSSVLFTQNKHTGAGKQIYNLFLSKSQAIRFGEEVGTEIKRKRQVFERISTLRKRLWTRSEEDFLNNYRHLPYRQLADILNRSEAAIKHKASRLS